MSQQNLEKIIKGIFDDPAMKEIVMRHTALYVSDEILTVMRNRLNPLTITVRQMEDVSSESDEESDEESEEESEEESDEEWEWECCGIMHAMDECCAVCNRWNCSCNENDYNPIHRKATNCRHCGMNTPTKRS